MTCRVASGDDDTLRLLVVSDRSGGVASQGDVAGIALLLFALLLAHSLGVGLLLGCLALLLCQDAVEGHTLLLGFLLCLFEFGLALLGFFLLLFVGLLFLVGFLLGSTLCLGGGEAFVGFLQEVGVVVERFHCQLTVSVDGALGVDVVAQRAAVIEFGTAAPRIIGRVGGVGRNPVECRYLVDGQFV